MFIFIKMEEKLEDTALFMRRDLFNKPFSICAPFDGIYAVDA
jgi:hypothetical protein